MMGALNMDIILSSQHSNIPIFHFAATSVSAVINVFPSQIEHVLRSLPEVGEQFMVTIDRINYLDEITIEVEMNKAYFSGELRDLTNVQQKIVTALTEVLGLRTTIKLVEPGSLPRFEGKAKRIIDRRGALW
jgi:phenylacetate-CoA ligase